MAAQKHEIDELVAHLQQADAPSLLVTGTRGSGKSKKNAESDAALAALKILRAQPDVGL